MPLETTTLFSPAEAASGTTRDVRVPGGGERTVTVLFPPVRGGTVLQVDGPDGPFLVRVMVASSILDKAPVLTGEGIRAVIVSNPAPSKQAGVGQGRRSGNKLGAQLAVIAVAVGLCIAFAVSRTSHGSSSGSSSSGGGSGDAIIVIGSCLSGTLPDSSTAQQVSGVNAVSCSSAAAHYKVIDSFVGDTDMTKCQSNPQTQYAFSETTTVNGNDSSEVLYCVVGLGSYAH
ncbi:LppU/SCO3897 family protein [Kitasatospora sp. LaBMicrA B282]|uniref:LppU/SCO3897 family protein n=1 Tax=Kitasatospora sp. LaBMicrA B282 TaxID=3420949 RepID=UPI003D0F0A31